VGDALHVPHRSVSPAPGAIERAAVLPDELRDVAAAGIFSKTLACAKRVLEAALVERQVDPRRRIRRRRRGCRAWLR
jgi:hypothetical protein